MSLQGSSIGRFRGKVDSILRDSFPAELIIGGVSVTGSGPGGRTTSEYVEGGEAENFRFPFRAPKADCPPNWQPKKGESLEWKVSPLETVHLEIIETAVRPWEDVFQFTARKLRR
jgi:hypothetical protein